jgi:hypothetical protein
MELPDWLSKIIVIILAITALYFAFSGIYDPDYVFSRYEKNLINYVGNKGLFIAWILAAIGCLWALWHMSKKSDKNSDQD